MILSEGVPELLWKTENAQKPSRRSGENASRPRPRHGFSKPRPASSNPIHSLNITTLQKERKKLRKLEKGWDSTPMRERPAELRGIKPVTPEPWARDEEFYQRKTGSFEIEYNSKEAYDDRSVLSASKGYESKYNR